MREIKFRAWDVFNNEMFPRKENGDLLVKFFREVNERRSGGNRVEVMQYTGLKDKNGKEIYEGDMLKFDEDEWGSEDSMFVVEWDDMGGRWIGYGSFSEWPKYCKVVGNMYEPPIEELVKSAS